MWHAWERKGRYKGFWWESPKERDNSEGRGVDGRMGSEWFLGSVTRGGGGGEVEWIPSGSGVTES
jgi:hypothetical protein